MAAVRAAIEVGRQDFDYGDGTGRNFKERNAAFQQHTVDILEVAALLKQGNPVAGPESAKLYSQEFKTQRDVLKDEVMLENGTQAMAVFGGARGGKAQLGPPPGVRLVNGRPPINSQYAGGRHPSGTRFSSEGFPDFSPVAKARVQIQGLTGNYATDAAMANQAAGLARTPKNMVWHHVEDARTMLLVPKSIHNAVRHTGGAAIIKELRALQGAMAQ